MDVPPRHQNPTRIFFYLLYVFLAAVWAVAMVDPGLRGGPLAVPFTALMAAHALLHDRAERVRGPVQAAAYLAVQTGLALALVVMAGRGGGIIDALWFPLAGESFAMFPGLWQRIRAFGLMGAGSLAGFLLTGRGSMLPVYLPVGLLALAWVGFYTVTYMRQLRDRERAESVLAQLEAAHRQLQDYAVQVEELSVAHERQRMARELHDTLAQGLAGLIMQLEAVDDLLARGDSDRARTVVQRTRERARNTLQEARATIQALRTPLERGDTVEAIRRQVEALQEDTGIHCSFAAGPGDLRLPGALAEPILRVVREGLANVTRHAGARHLSVRLSASPEQVELEIADDGAGFDPAAAAGRPGHYGLVGLAERIDLAGGTLRIDSRPGAGTRLYATLPATPRREESSDAS